MGITNKQEGACLRMLFDEVIQGTVKTVMNGKHRIEFHIYINVDDERVNSLRLAMKLWSHNFDGK